MIWGQARTAQAAARAARAAAAAAAADAAFMAEVDAEDVHGWTLVDHACRVCLGRVAERGGVFRCCDCGVRGVGGPSSICGCGIRVAEGVHRRLPFACTPNPHQCAEAPAVVTIAFGEMPAPARAA